MSSAKVAFIGVTGMLGKPVAHELINAGFQVYALGRNEKKVKDIFGDKVFFIPLDLKDRKSVENSLAGMDFVYLNLSIKPYEKEKDFHTEYQGLNYVIEACRKHKIKRIGYISSIIALKYQHDDWWVMRIKKQAIRAIQNSGIPYCIFYPSSFMENFLNSFKRNGFILVISGFKNKNWWIAGKDYGMYVARSFQILDGGESRDYIVQGPDPLTMEEAADIFVRSSRRKFRKIKIPLVLMKFASKFSDFANYGYRILDIIESIPEPFMSQKTWDELGRPTITIEKFASDYV
ncbi:MAG: NAD(P)H-binding protein [Candidatus Calescibacterium sp.]|nr:NAD(P)H-binding protein [Candidatus Calescibacterium sp.]MCX7733520.1 NAD(P)H-binding protein [bacterium]MDW8087233.1 NAD(P)H-binding protein [Candidatus Calescibacterium sp.]